MNLRHLLADVTPFKHPYHDKERFSAVHLVLTLVLFILLILYIVFSVLAFLTGPENTEFSFALTRTYVPSIAVEVAASCVDGTDSCGNITLTQTYANSGGCDVPDASATNWAGSTSALLCYLSGGESVTDGVRVRFDSLGSGISGQVTVAYHAMNYTVVIDSWQRKTLVIVPTVYIDGNEDNAIESIELNVESQQYDGQFPSGSNGECRLSLAQFARSVRHVRASTPLELLASIGGAYSLIVSLLSTVLFFQSLCFRDDDVQERENAFAGILAMGALGAAGAGKGKGQGKGQGKGKGKGKGREHQVEDDSSDEDYSEDDYTAYATDYS